MTEILVDPNLSSDQFALMGAPFGQFLAFWVKDGVITSARFGVDGTRFGDDVTLNDADAPATWPVVTRLPTGAVVAWISGSDLFLQATGESGTRVGGPKKVNTAPVDPTSPPALTGLGNGSFVVCWADGTREAVRGQIYYGNLTTPYGPIAVNVPTDGNFGTAGNVDPVPHGLVSYGPAVTSLGVYTAPAADTDPGYAFVVAWRRGMSVGMTSAHFRFFDLAGHPQPAPPPLPPKDQAGHPTNYEHMARYDVICRPNSLTAGVNNGFCAVRLVAGRTLGPTSTIESNMLVIDWYDHDGNQIMSDDVTHDADDTVSAAPVIATTPTNDLVVVWCLVDQHSATPGTWLKGYVRGMGFGGPTPAPQAPVVTITSLPSGPPSTPRVAFVSTDDGFVTVVGWVEGTTLKIRTLQNDDLQHAA